VSLSDYTLENFGTPEGKITHLTNNSVQKKHPDYNALKEQSILTLDTLGQELISSGKISSVEEFKL